MKKPRNIVPAFFLLATGWLVGVAPAAAQQVQVDCTVAPTFTPSPNFCQGVQYVFPPNTCGCTNRTYGNVCAGGTITGITQDGVNGCLLQTACTITEVETSCVPVEPICVECQKNAPPQAGGKPVSLANGNMFFTHPDATVGTLSFSRTYNTQRLTGTRYGMFGPGWNTSFEKRLAFLSSGVVEYRDSGGNPVYFQDEDLNGNFQQQVPVGKDQWLLNLGVGYRLVRRQGGQEDYTTSGLLVSETDAAGITTTYTRDGSGRLATVSRDGRSFTLTYIGTQTKPATLQGPAGDTLATFTYEAASGRLAAVDYPESAGYRYVYDSAGRILFVDDADGRPSEAHEYDAQGRAITSEKGDGREKLTFSYDTVNNKTTVTDALGRQTVHEFGLVKHVKMVKKVTGPCNGPCGAGAEVQEWTYDATSGVVTSKKDQAGKTWTYVHDPATLDLLSETDPLNQTTTYSYDAQGRMLTRTGPDGSLTTYVQSDPGPTSIAQKVSDTPLVTRTTNIQYFTTADAKKGKVESITDPRGKTTTMAYDATTGDLLSVTDPLGHSTGFAYDEAPSPAGRGLRTSVTDALGHTTKTVYEGRNRVKKVINHDNTFTEFAYDAAGRRSSVTDPMGRVTRYIYDRYGRLDTVVDPMSQSTRYSYDLMGNLLTLTDAKNQTTTFEYDVHDRVKRTIYPGGAFETFTYDSRGRLTTMVDRKNVTTTYAYDDLGRLTGKTFTDGTPAFSYTYDLAGRMLTAQNGTDTLTWTYNLAGELLSEQSVKNASTVAYTYDDGGNRLSVSLDGTLFVTYAYDDASRLTTITRGTNVFGFGYDNANRRISMSYPNGVDTTYTYDTLNRLTNLAATKTSTGTPITNFGYQYDAAGNRTQKSTLDYTEDYGYDPLYRLTRTERTNPGATPPNQWTWNYDAVGNRTSAQKDSEATTSSYNEKNQLTGSTGGGKMLWRGTLDEPGIATFSAPTINGQPARMLAGNVFEATLDLPAGANNVTIQAQDGSGNIATKVYSVNVIGVPSTYTYDANGNLTQKLEGGDTWTYSWDAENRLVDVKKNAVVQASFKYDPSDRRIEKTVNGVTYRFVYDNEDWIRRTGGTTMDVVHSPGIDEPIAQDVGGAVTYYHADALGSVQTHTNSSGGITTTIQFDAWGNALVGALGPYGFTGREPDSETGLQFYRSRYYDSGLGRFVSEDRSGYVDGPNLYRYVKGRPTQFKDPSGRQTAAEKKYCSDPANQESCTKGLVCAAMATVIFAGFDDGTPGNAMKHCVWSCCLVRMAGPEAAYQITTAHEDGQRDRCASSQDKANNAKGMAFGLANPNKTCFEVCDPRNLQCEKKAPPCSP